MVKDDQSPYQKKARVPLIREEDDQALTYKANSVRDYCEHWWKNLSALSGWI